MEWQDFSISRPITSGINFWTKSFNVPLVASFAMISVILLRIWRICALCAYVVFLTWFGRLLVKAMTKIRKRYPSVVLTSACASMRVCHLRTRDLSLSLVNDIPEKLVRQFFPWTSSTRSLILRKACSSSFCRSARETSKMRPFRASLADSSVKRDCEGTYSDQCFG